jgi:hypothetical protein
MRRERTTVASGSERQMSLSIASVMVWLCFAAYGLLDVATLTLMNTSGQSWDSLIAALNQARIPLANHGYVRRLTDAIGISECEAVDASERYVRAVRRDGSGELRIYSGYTLGFSENEATCLGAGADTVRQSSKSKAWFISHPVHGDLEPRGSAARRTQREAAVCSGCGEQKSLSGACFNCDD